LTLRIGAAWPIVSYMLARSTLIALLTALCCAVSASGAWALRYAGPTGISTQDCLTVATACDLQTAIQTAAAGEEVVVEPGNYTVGSEIAVSKPNLDIHGVEGQPRPVITGGGGIIQSGGNPITLSYLDFEGSGGLLNISDGMLDRLVIRGYPGGDVLCQCSDGTLRDSVVVATGLVVSSGGAVGLLGNGSTAGEDLRNDTIISTFHGTPAINLEQQNATPQFAHAAITFTAENVIALDLGGGTSVLTGQPQSTQTTEITFHHSDVGTPSTSGGATVVTTDADITTAPLFADAATDDFHELAGSPTIDTGLDSALDGPVDFDGLPRMAGAATDMGAFEVQPPVVVAPVITPAPLPPPAPAPAPALPPPPRLSITGRAFTVSSSTAKVTVPALCTAATPGRCTVTGTLTTTAALHGAHSAKASKPTVVGTLRGTLTAGRRGTLTLTLDRAAAAALRPGARGPIRHLAVTLSATVSAAKASGPLTAHLSVAVHRPPAKHHR
jgi:hypothetical protein